VCIHTYLCAYVYIHIYIYVYTCAFIVSWSTSHRIHAQDDIVSMYFYELERSRKSFRKLGFLIFEDQNGWAIEWWRVYCTFSKYSFYNESMCSLYPNTKACAIEAVITSLVCCLHCNTHATHTATHSSHHLCAVCTATHMQHTLQHTHHITCVLSALSRGSPA